MKKILTHSFILSLLIIVGLILVNNQGWLNPVKNLFYSLVTPSYQISFQFNKFFGFVTSINQLEHENIQFREENQELLGQIAQLEGIAKENELFRRQIGSSGPKFESEKLILANIVGQDTSNLRKYFLINKGTKDGLELGSVVIAAGNLLVGRVIEVTNSFAKVQSIIDSNSRVNALIFAKDGLEITGLIKGDQGLNLIIDLLPQGEVVEQGQLIVTSGLAGLFPAGLLIGQIEKVISSDVQISQMAELKPAIDFERLRNVFVIVR
ncbi:rod shape-determining protein MreC [Patescibacteria group bacterium]|nr:rod shape-determining protein MreC [Patescibacteria group bacterium]MBU1563464.1 rod shape-determining protein MreC [Patescibacteria group bacterium]MBU2068533.1 rod shape-determining protein MreC [Patescibacteria group bacterium]